MTEGTGEGRNHPSSHSARTAEFRVDFFLPLTQWLASRRAAGRTGRILDFGCADLLLARGLDGTWVVDGYDEWESARAAARRQLLNLREPGVVHDRLEDIPRGAYDAVVLNSLFQYVPDQAAAAQLLGDAAPLLSTDAAIGIVITDVVSDGASPVHDLVDLLRYAVQREGLVGGLRATVRGVRSGKPARRHSMPERTLAAAAATVGLRVERLPASLTVFSRRATFVLHAVR